MSSPILVTGGTGTLGRRVVPRLIAAGHHVRVLTRQDRSSTDGSEMMKADLTTGEGIDAAVRDVQTVLHLAGSAKGDELKTSTLVRAACAAGVRHLVYISVVGADRVPVVSAIDRAMFGYFASKLAAERVVSESGLPWTTLRATQFHDAMLTVAKQMSRMPVIPVPAGVSFQPVDTDEVAARLVELTLGRPAGLVPDMAGPQVLAFADLLRAYLDAVGKSRIMLTVRMPGRAARAVSEGANLARDRAVGLRTWEGFLAHAAMVGSVAVAG